MIVMIFKISPTLRSCAAPQALLHNPRGFTFLKHWKLYEATVGQEPGARGEHGAKEILRTFLHQGMKDVPWQQIPKIKVPSNQVMKS